MYVECTTSVPLQRVFTPTSTMRFFSANEPVD